MKKKIAILGSTGSIGKTLINILKKDKKKFEIILLVADKNYKEILKQAKIFNVKNIILKNIDAFNKIKKKNKLDNINIYCNYDSIDKIFKKKIDYVMSSISGFEGLSPTLKIIRHTKKIAIANKESIICGWNLLSNELKKNKTKFVPVDSEHFSIYYALKNNLTTNIETIYLTASGGPLLKHSTKQLKKVKINDVLKHPTWNMGKKISIDSATLMNKVFEVIEAKKIFNLSYEKLKILIHPNSYVHTLIKFYDGMIKIIAHDTDMMIPIKNSIYKDESSLIKTKKIDIKKLNNLNFKKVDYNQFLLIKILSKLPNKDSLFETVLVATNDEYVKLYLDNKIKFNVLSKSIYEFLNLPEFNKYKFIKPKKIEDIEKLNRYVRLKINNLSV